eukprot:PhM_4_TR2035/c0_g1_i1/m.39486
MEVPLELHRGNVRRPHVPAVKVARGEIHNVAAHVRLQAQTRVEVRHLRHEDLLHTRAAVRNHTGGEAAAEGVLRLRWHHGGGGRQWRRRGRALLDSVLHRRRRAHWGRHDSAGLLEVCLAPPQQLPHAIPEARGAVFVLQRRRFVEDAGEEVLDAAVRGLIKEVVAAVDFMEVDAARHEVDRAQAVVDWAHFGAHPVEHSGRAGLGRLGGPHRQQQEAAVAVLVVRPLDVVRDAADERVRDEVAHALLAAHVVEDNVAVAEVLPDDARQLRAAEARHHGAGQGHEVVSVRGVVNVSGVGLVAAALEEGGVVDRPQLGEVEADLALEAPHRPEHVRRGDKHAERVCDGA